MAIGMAANTSIGRTGTCDASRQDWQVRRCSATSLTTVASNRGWPATAWPSCVVGRAALAPHDLGPHHRVRSRPRPCSGWPRSTPSSPASPPPPRRREAVAVVQVEHLADLVAQHLGRFPQQAGHGRVGGQRAHLGAAGQAILGVGTHRQAQVHPLGIGGGMAWRAARMASTRKGSVAGLLGDPAVGGREGTRPRCARRRRW